MRWPPRRGLADTPPAPRKSRGPDSRVLRLPGSFELLDLLAVPPTPLSGSVGGESLGAPASSQRTMNVPGPSLESVNSQKWMKVSQGEGVVWTARAWGPGPPCKEEQQTPAPFAKYCQVAAHPLLRAAAGGGGVATGKGWGRINPSWGTPLSGPAAAATDQRRARPQGPAPVRQGASAAPRPLSGPGVQTAGGDAGRRWGLSHEVPAPGREVRASGRPRSSGPTCDPPGTCALDTAATEEQRT